MNVHFKTRHNVFPGLLQDFNTQGWAKTWEYEWHDHWLFISSPDGKTFAFPRESIDFITYEQNDTDAKLPPNGSGFVNRSGSISGIEVSRESGSTVGGGTETPDSPPFRTAADPTGDASGPEQEEGRDLHSTFGEDVSQPPRRPRGRPRKSVG